MPNIATSTAAVEIVPENASRKSVVFLNEDTTDSIFIKRERNGAPTVSSTDHDYKLTPGASLGLDIISDGEQAVKARYTCVASANTPRLAFFESEDIHR